MAGDFVVNVNGANYASEVEQSSVTVVVDFWAPWCGPCRMIAPILDEIATEKAGAVKIAKVNVDEDPELSSRFGVRNIPTLLFVKNGQVSGQVVGMASKKDLLSKIEALA